MAYNGSGTFTLVAGNPVVTGTTISSTWANNTLNDIATGLSTAITKDGQTTPTANIPMGGYKITGLGAATVNGDAVRYEQVASLRQAQTGTYFTTAGTTTAYTLTPTPAITSLLAGQRFNVVFNAANTTASTTLAISGLTAKTLKVYNSAGAKVDPAIGQISANMISDVIYDGTDYLVVDPLPSGVADSANDFRLTLTTGVPVTIADVTGATTVYATPYTGNRISLFNGSIWVLRQSAQFSLALGTLTSGLPYDVFCYDNAGVPTLEFTAWTNSTTRATALAYQDGILCKTGALTRRYLGTFYTTSTTETEDSKSKRYLFNYYHRKTRFLERNETTANWTYSTPTWRQSNGSTANQVNWFTGVVEDGVEVNAIATVQTNNSLYQSSAIGINSITVPTGQFGTTGASSSTSYPNCTMPSQYRGLPQLGLNYAAMLEWSQGGATTTWYGQNNDASTQTQSGITATVMQ